MNSHQIVLAFLPAEIAKALTRMPPETYVETDEIRIRRSRPLSVVIKSKTAFVSPRGELCRAERGLTVTSSMTDECIALLTGGSRYALDNAIASGYIPFCGMRAGVCGRTLVKNGVVTTIADIDCIDIRLPRRVDGFASELYKLFCTTQIRGTLVISPPGVGKTTYLRSLIVLMSQRYRVAVCDCRGELLCGGVADLPIDAMTSCPKGYAIETLTRTMNPEVIICDELGADEEDAVMQNAFCGVPIIASVHASDISSALLRPFVHNLCRAKVFELYAQIDSNKSVEIGEIKCV